MAKHDGADEDLAELLADNEALRQEVEELQQEIEDLQFEAALDACHAAGLTAQIKALIAEGEACPHRVAHSLLERVEYTDARSGETIRKTRAYPLYRQAFDDEAAEHGILDPERYRA